MNAHEDLFAPAVRTVPGESLRSTPAFAKGGPIEPSRIVVSLCSGPEMPNLPALERTWQDALMLLRSGPRFIALNEATLQRCHDLVARVLASQGDAADRDLIQLQHDLAELLRPPASPAPEPSTEPT